MVLISRRRARKKESHGNLERWLITYADMITLLLIFFIVMYAISRIDAYKFQALAASLAEAMGAGGMIMESPGPSFVPGASESPGDELSEKQELESIRRKLEAFARKKGLSAKITATTEQRGIVLSFQEDVLFALGSAELTPEAKKLIGEVAPILLETNNYLRVEGHTDNLPIHTRRYPSNWELSAARATSVLQQLLKTADFEPGRLSAVAYGEYRPRVPNDSPENRQLNRRVDIVILRSKYEGSEPVAPRTASPPDTTPTITGPVFEQ